VKPIAERLVAIQEAVHIIERLCGVDRRLQTVKTALQLVGFRIELQECCMQGITGLRRNQ